MGLTNLDALQDFIAVNEHNHGLYTSGLADLPGLARGAVPVT